MSHVCGVGKRRRSSWRVPERLKALQELGWLPSSASWEHLGGDLLSFLDQLHQQVASVPLEGVDAPQKADQIRHLGLQEILLTRQRARTDREKVVTAYQKLWQQIGHLGALQQDYPAWCKALAACFYRPRRSSSLAETIDSPLRTLQQIHRNLSQPLVDLYAARQTMKPFANGCRRRGKSPYQRLGVDLGTDDWLEALRMYRAAS